VTRDQERARELIALIEGTNLECRMDGGLYVIKSELGAIYTVDRFGEHIWRNGWSRPKTLTDLECMADEPMFHPDDSPEYTPVEPYGGPRDDFNMESAIDRARERRKLEDDREFYRRGEAA
jgi:hypothetical protein